MPEEIKESESMKITALANKMKRGGDDVIKLSIGDSHFCPPDSIINKAKEAIDNGKTHYLDSTGILELRENINRTYYDNKYKTSEIIIVPGLKQGLYYLLNSLKGNKVCLLEPYWLGYENTIKLSNKKLVSVNLRNKDWITELENKDFDILILCNPNNPDGKILSKKELKRIVDICKNKDSYLISDEIYKHFDYNNNFISSSKFNYNKIIVIDGFSKAFAVSGLRVGFMIIKNKDIFNRVRILQQNIATCTNSLTQYSLLEFDRSLSQVEKFKKYYEANKDLIADIIPEFRQYKPDGGFYYFVNLLNFGVNDGFEFSKKLLKEAGIAVVPGSAYGRDFNSWIRFSFSIEREKLKEGIVRMKNYLIGLNDN